MTTLKSEVIKNSAVTLLIVSILGAAGIGGYFLVKELKEAKKQNQLFIESAAKLNKKFLLQKTLAERMPKEPIETVLAISDRLFEMHQLKKIPLPILCGLIDIESGFNTRATSEVGAKGLMQVMPATARPYLMSDKLNYDPKILYDPVVNITVGASYLADLQAQHLENGVVEEGNWTLALHSYFWNTNNTYSLYGKKDTRVNVPNFSYPIRVMEAAKYYIDKGL